MYSAQLLDHFEHPRNCGELPEANASADCSNPACGDMLRLQLRIAAGIIEAARFLAKGCVPTVACGSALAEWLQGKSLHNARTLSSAELSALLGGLPAHSRHAAELAIECLQGALKNAPQN